MKSFLREPLLHFLLIGGGLFLAYTMLDSPQGRFSADGKPQIRVTDGDIRWLSETWSRQWQREPSPEEMRGLISDYVREQILAEEARSLGLDENDTVIRRRLAQKVEFLVRDTAALAEPTEDELRAYHARHADRYDREARLTFRQIYFNPDRRADASGDARGALEAIRRSPAVETSLGDTSLLGTEFLEVEEHAIRSMFGEAFASKLADAPIEEWTGPIESAYGFHLVLLSKRKPGGKTPFEEVLERVKNEWVAEQQRLAHEAYFHSLLQKYEIVMDEPFDVMERPSSGAEKRAI